MQEKESCDPWLSDKMRAQVDQTSAPNLCWSDLILSSMIHLCDVYLSKSRKFVWCMCERVVLVCAAGVRRGARAWSRSIVCGEFVRLSGATQACTA